MKSRVGLSIDVKSPLSNKSGNSCIKGYKEFDEYLAAIENGEKDSAILKSLKEQSVERMKVATRRYAKRQVQWIRNKLLPTIWNTQDTIKELTIPSISLSPSKSIEIYLLDATGK
jgi:tRNA A37 N6-isopentenylltransferase MiaA